MHKIMLAICLSFVCLGASAQSTVGIKLNKSQEGAWTLSYYLSEAVERLQLVRATIDSRKARWTPLSDNTMIEFQDGNSFIFKQDSSTFSEVHFSLDTSYIWLPKDYVPFSSFSDGGMLLHTGRFFACAESCNGSQLEWTIELKVPENDSIIVDGNKFVNTATWNDSDSGQKVYVGQQQFAQSEQFIFLIDPGLPQTLREQLLYYVPRLFEYYANKLVATEKKTTLFASYSPTNDGRYGNQGGVIQNQISMHWYGDLVAHSPNLNDTFWFFSHEVAHVFQRSAPTDHNHGWIHEGSAELMAALSMQSILPGELDYVANRVNKAINDCESGLTTMKLTEAASQSRFDLMYSCGMLINYTIHNAKNDLGKRADIYQLWLQFQAKVVSGAAADQRTWLKLISKAVPNSHYKSITNFVVPDSLKPFYQLLHHMDFEGSGVVR